MSIPRATRMLCLDCQGFLAAGRGAPPHGLLERGGQRQVLGNGRIAEAYDTFSCRACGAKWRREVLPAELEGEWQMSTGD